MSYQVITCLTCNKVAYRDQAFARRKTPKKKALEVHPETPATLDNVNIEIKHKKTSSKRFSFLDKLDSQQIASSGNLGTSDFVSFSRARDTSTTLNAHKKRPFASISASTTDDSYYKGGFQQNCKVSLDDLERKMKKEKKKAAAGGLSSNFLSSSVGTTGLHKSGSGSSLNSLQSMFTSLSGRK